MWNYEDNEKLRFILMGKEALPEVYSLQFLKQMFVTGLKLLSMDINWLEIVVIVAQNLS